MVANQEKQVDTMREAKTEKRRQYSAEFKREVLEQCERPGATIVGVALGHGLNANLVHKWRRGRGCELITVQLRCLQQSDLLRCRCQR